MNNKLVIMRHSIYIFILSFLIFCSDSYAQSYEKMWDNISEYQKRGLPQSVIAQAYKIYNKASQENNKPQIIKSFLTAMQYREDISPDSMNIDIKSLDKMASESKDIEEKSLLYSILAKLTADRDPLKAIDYVKTSMKDAAYLVLKGDDIYSSVISSGPISEKYFKNNMLHIISNINLNTLKGIDNRVRSKKVYYSFNKANIISDFEKQLLAASSEKDCKYESLKIYQTLLHEYKRVGLMDAWIITASNLLNELKQYIKGYNDNDASNNLLKLADDFSKYESVAYPYSLLIDMKFSNQEYVEALDMIRGVINKYPKYVNVEYLKIKEQEIISSSILVTSYNLYAGVVGKLRVTYRNTPYFKINIYNVDKSISPLLLYNDVNYKNNNIQKGELVKSEKYSLSNYKDYKYHNEDIDILIENPGIYYLELEDYNGKKEGKIICITSFLPIIQSQPNGDKKVIILDALNGKPIKDARFNIYSEESGNSRKLTFEDSIMSNADGVVYVDANKKVSRYNITKGDDKAMEINNFRTETYRSFTDYKKERVSIFTDRSIYKPGQIVNFSGFSYTMVDDSAKILPLKEYEVTLLDANHSPITSINVTTDNYGAFNGQFTLPKLSLNGRYCIKIISCETSFMVEEYKRPTFNIDFMPIEDSFSIGDTINVIGYAKNLLDMPLKNLSVKYKINSSAYFKTISEEIEEGVVKSDEKGFFSIPIVITEHENNLSKYWYKHITLSAIATDVSGESIENSITIPYGTTSLIINCEGLNETVLKENNDSVLFRVNNLFGNNVDCKVHFKLYNIGNSINDSTLILESYYDSNKIIPMDWVKNLNSGRYKVILQCSDNKNRESEFNQEFLLFSIKDKRPPIYNDFWIYNDDKINEKLYFGTSMKDVNIYFSILAKDRIIEDKIYVISDSIINVDCAYKKEYGDGVEINIAFVKDGKVYSYNKKIIKPLPFKKLVLNWETFRDKLQPGKREEWKLKITYPDGKPANAQLMSTMYDASLDEIYKDRWNFDLYYTRDVNSYPFTSYQGETCYFNITEQTSNYRKNISDYSVFDLPYLHNWGNSNYPILLSHESISLNTSSANMRDNSVGLKTQSLSIVDNSTIALRKDFSETAFFYPQLNCDKNGVVKISFSLPETLTKWHFIAFAHSENVDYGMIEADIVSYKEFMVKTELPRFLRSGDRCIIPISVTNLKDHDVRGELYFEMIDPISNKVIYSSSKKFEVNNGDKNSYEFEYIVPDNYSMIICRVVGKGKKFSDGEQNIIPVLSDKEIVTKSVPIVISDEGKYSYNIDSSKDKKVTLEVTANPIWHVVQAIPNMLNPKEYDAYSWASALYASYINEYIVNNIPAIHNLSSLFKSLPVEAHNDMLSSELQKNQDLKEIFLAETPWIAKANNEESQRKLLSQIGDINYINYNRKVAIEHLIKLQNIDGSWSWFNGMQGNTSITADILESLVRAKSIVDINQNDNVNNMILSSFSFLKNEVDADYKSRNEKNQLVNGERKLPVWLVKYLYICALNPSLNCDKVINSYYIDLLKNSASTLDIYQKSLASVIFQKLGFNEVGDQFLESLLQYTVYSKELGRYYDTKRAEFIYSSNIIPSVVSTIEAFQLSKGKEKQISEMKKWLIAMKGVQSWSSNIATINAIFALLDKNAFTYNEPTGFINIYAGGETFKINKDEPLGYIKRDINNRVNNITIEKTYPGISYGSVYIQGIEKIDTLKSSSSILSIKKTLYRGNEIVDENTILNIGDVVKVCLILESPVNMDFVQIKDPIFSCMQPRQQMSSIMWQGDMVYNNQIKNSSVNIFIDKLSKGTHTIYYDMYITKKGSYKSGITVVESAYFPMLRSFTSSPTINIK